MLSFESPSISGSTLGELFLVTRGCLNEDVDTFSEMLGLALGGLNSVQYILVTNTWEKEASRAEAVDNVESTIHELGNTFTQLATMVSQQGELAIRSLECVNGSGCGLGIAHPDN
uniref:Syntaxin-32-like isoform X1 n=1 Tax=Tanacetum cinerariifolium TaxID=118510 RepID=A0A699HHL2_TANCI|nr:syntaxin-32-like isoform X1 [Tanacetum cinerariifolium]